MTINMLPQSLSWGIVHPPCMASHKILLPFFQGTIKSVLLSKGFFFFSIEPNTYLRNHLGCQGHEQASKPESSTRRDDTLPE